MLQLTFSNGLEPLVSALADDIKRWRAGNLERLLCPLVITVPDRLVARALKLRLADTIGISVNVRFPFLAGALAECLGPTLGPRLLTRERITERLLIALDDQTLLAETGLEQARRYVDTGDPRSSAIRRVELASELTRLYLDYASSRPQDFERWANGQVNFGVEDQDGWQRRLWRYICDPGLSLNHDELENLATEQPTMAPLASLICTAQDDQLTPPAALFVVGATDASPSQRLMLERISHLCQVFIYAVNPCREFWEDLDRSPDECPPLAYWGTAGRAPIRLLSEIAEFDWNDQFVTPQIKSVLGRIKLDVLSRSYQASARPALAKDSSVLIASCPSIRRELEFIAEHIWTLTQAHPDLKLTEIAVLLAGSDHDLYRAQLSSVFAELGRLPHHIVNVPLTEESRVVEAFSWLLSLPLGNFTRPEMLRVLAHPAIGGTDPDIDSFDWIRWARDLGVFFGENASAQEGTYLPGDLYHWDQALLRLNLGSCVETGPEAAPISVSTRVLIPHHQAPDQRRSAGRLTLLCRSLFSDTRWLRSQQLPLHQWSNVLWRFASAYIETTSDREQADLGRCRKILGRLGDPSNHHPVSYDVALELARSAIASLRTRRGEPLLDGVCVSSLKAPPLVPFRFIFMAGLSSGTFPRGSDAKSGIDARDSQQAFEPSPRQRDRYAFLHALMAASDGVICSYVGRDPHSGEELPPSSVIAELSKLANRELTASAKDFLRISVPAWAHDDPLVDERGVNLRARRRRLAAALSPKWTLKVKKGSNRRQALEYIRHHSSAGERHLLGLQASQSEQPRQTTAREPSRELSRELSTAQLTSFLEQPIDCWSQVVLGIGSRERSDRSAYTEPLDLTALDAAIICRAAVSSAAIEDDSDAGLDQRIAAAAESIRLRGLGPSGVIAEWQIARAADRARCWWQRYKSCEIRSKMTSIAIGRAAAAATIEELLPPVSLGDTPLLEAHGMLPLISIDGDAQFYFKNSTSSLAPIYARTLRGLIDHTLLAAANRVRNHTCKIFIIDEKKSHTIIFQSFSAEEAQHYLSSLAQSLMGESHAYLLAGTTLLANYLKGKPLTRGLARASQARPPAYVASLPRRPGDFELPTDLNAIIEKRYQPLFSLIEDSSMGQRGRR